MTAKVAGALFTVTIIVAGALALGTVAKPIYRAPDEAGHADLAYGVFVERSYPEPQDRNFAERVRNSREVVGHGDWGPDDLTAANAPSRNQRGPFADFGDEQPSHLSNYIAQHPPAYYVAAGAWLELVSFAIASPVTELNFDLVVWLLRLFSAVLIVPVPVLAFATASRVGIPVTGAVVAAAATGAIPMFVYIGSAVNNDNLLVLGFAGLAWLLAGVTAGDRRWRTAVSVALLGGVALLTKLFAFVIFPWIVVAYLMGALRVGWRSTVVPALVGVGGSGLIGGWWWVSNLIQHGELQPQAAALPAAEAGFEPDLGWWLPFAAGRLIKRFWIEPNIVPWDVHWPELTATTLFAVLVIGGVAAAVRGGRGAELGVQLLPFSLMLAGVAYGAWSLYADTGQPVGLHGRYFYGGVIGLATSVGMLLAVAREHTRRWFLWTAIAGVVAIQATGTLLVVSGFYGLAYEGLTDSVRAMLAWSPPSPVAFLAGTALLVVVAATVSALAPKMGHL